jgi:hypothetical protein
MQTTILILGGLILLIIILYIVGKNKNSNETKPIKLAKFYSVYTPNGLQLVRKLEEMFENNEALRFAGEMNLYKQMFNDISGKDVDEFEKAVGIEGHIDENEGTLKYIAGDYLTMLAADLGQRHLKQYISLTGIGESEAIEKYGLNINSNEFIYDTIKNVDWYEEKTITTSYSYGGFQYKIGGGNGMSYRMGNLSVVANTTQKFTQIDRGQLYITNKRIIFIGTEKRVNKSIDLDDILEFSIFRDGLLIGKANGKKPLIQFPEWLIQPNKAPLKRDHLNRTVRVLDRVIRKTQDETITE